MALLTSQAEVSFRPSLITASDIVGRISAIGFSASILEERVSHSSVLNLSVCAWCAHVKMCVCMLFDLSWSISCRLYEYCAVVYCCMTLPTCAGTWFPLLVVAHAF